MISSLDTPSTPNRSTSHSIYLHQAVVTLHNVLYSTNTTQSDISDYVLNNYEAGDAMYENALVTAKGRLAIARQFYVISYLPGEIYSDLEEIFESEAWGGHRSFTMIHTIHWCLMPWLRRPFTPSNSAHSSFVHTPYQQQTPGSSPQLPTPARIRAQHKNSQWPVQQLMKNLHPANLLRSATNLQIRVHSRVQFNERGKIVKHEDTWGIKEVIEGFLPLLAPLYHIQRIALGASVSIVTGILTPRSPSPPPTETRTNIDPDDADDESELGADSALGLTLEPSLLALQSVSLKLQQSDRRRSSRLFT